MDRQLKGKDKQTAEVIEGSIGGFGGSRTCKVRGTNVRACHYLGNGARSTRLSTGTNRNDKVMRGVLGKHKDREGLRWMAEEQAWKKRKKGQ